MIEKSKTICRLDHIRASGSCSIFPSQFIMDISSSVQAGLAIQEKPKIDVSIEYSTYVCCIIFYFVFPNFFVPMHAMASESMSATMAG